MSQLTESTFSTYRFTNQEETLAVSLTTLQAQFIQNQLALIAEQRIALVPDPLQYNIFIQDEAYLKGQMAAYRYLLDCSREAQERMLQEAREQAAVQSQY